MGWVIVVELPTEEISWEKDGISRKAVFFLCNLNFIMKRIETDVNWFK